uniref:RRM domain-containing protein n=1 Tax=Musca domestica TaxID=7370 RepID=A0A1I8M5Y6_MUSDO
MISNSEHNNGGAMVKGNFEPLPVILENGRKVYGPPSNYTDPPPTYQCELYVTRIPTHLDELTFLMWLHRIGRVYEFRLMMDSGSSTRGYAFIRFCSESEALAAFELLKHLFVSGSDDRLGVYRSQGKNRLYISGIPRSIPLNMLQEQFKLCFPQMHNCTAYPPVRNMKTKPLPSFTAMNFVGAAEKEENRGFAFIEFKDHEMALEAKKRLTPGRVRMWGVDLKVQWAKPKEELQGGMKNMNGYPYNRLSGHPFIPNDFCAKLRLYCLANNLCIPIVVYGPISPVYYLQYAGILIKDSTSGRYSMMIFEILFDRMSDIHLAMCELAVKMIERNVGQIFDHSLFRIVSDTKAELVYTFKSHEELCNERSLYGEFLQFKTILNLAYSLKLLAEHNSEKLLILYKRSFLTSQQVASFELDSENTFSKFYSILPTFRNNQKLNNNFNNMEINLLQNPEIEHLPIRCNTDLFKFPKYGNERTFGKKSIREHFNLKSQHGYGVKYILAYVDYNSLAQRTCYHVEQRVNSNPIWIAGQSYQKSIYN